MSFLVFYGWGWGGGVILLRKIKMNEFCLFQTEFQRTPLRTMAAYDIIQGTSSKYLHDVFHILIIFTVVQLSSISLLTPDMFSMYSEKHTVKRITCRVAGVHRC